MNPFDEIDDPPPESETPSQILLRSKTPDSAAWKFCVKIFKLLTGPGIRLEDVTRLPLRERLHLFWEKVEDNSEDLRSFLIGLVFCLAVFIGLVAGPTAVSAIQLDGIALSTSPACGVWMHPNQTRRMLYVWTQAEEQSAAYYRNCYEANSSTRVCNIFANNDPLSITTDSQVCPFQEDMCLLGPSSAITFDTGMVSAKTLGVNSKNQAYYQRRSTCAPVKSNGFVDMQDNYSGFLIQSQFYYGPRSYSNSTFDESRIFGLPGLTVPAYEVTVRKAWYDTFE